MFFGGFFDDPRTVTVVRIILFACHQIRIGFEYRFRYRVFDKQHESLALLRKRKMDRAMMLGTLRTRFYRIVKEIAEQITQIDGV